MYTYQAFGDRYVLSLENHVEITKALTMFCSDYSALAGHLLEATLSGAGEFVIEAFEGSLERYYNTSVGLNLYRLRK